MLNKRTWVQLRTSVLGLPEQIEPLNEMFRKLDGKVLEAFPSPVDGTCALVHGRLIILMFLAQYGITLLDYGILVSMDGSKGAFQRDFTERFTSTERNAWSVFTSRARAMLRAGGTVIIDFKKETLTPELMVTFRNSDDTPLLFLYLNNIGELKIGEIS